jgi:hypothetical protein
MAALTTSSGATVRQGVNGVNVQHFTGAHTGDVANSDTLAVTLPDYQKGPWTVIGYEIWTESAGVRTYRTKAQFVLTSFNQNTGVANFTLVAGGTLSNPGYSVSILAAE